jgi:hypothetical protein
MVRTKRSASLFTRITITIRFRFSPAASRTIGRRHFVVDSGNKFENNAEVTALYAANDRIRSPAAARPVKWARPERHRMGDAQKELSACAAGRCHRAGAFHQNRASGGASPRSHIESFPTQTYAPTRIMAIRHAEKPVGQFNGIDGFGNPDSTSLIPQGWQRAGALVPLFGSSFGALPTPSYLFAPNIADSVTSRRPFETITPLAAALGITINAAPGAVTPGQYDAADYPAMVSAALTCPGVVLIAWEHEAIPLIGNTILGNATAVPQTWPSARFDIVWIFDLNPTTNVYTFNQAPQLLLQGDLPFPISY